MLCQLTPLASDRCYVTALEWLPELEAQPLTWSLDSLLAAGYSSDEPLVSEGIAQLSSLQGERGLWADDKYSAIETTISALRILLGYGGFHDA